MAEFDFSLSYRLPASGTDPEEWLGALLAQSCDDATVGIGRLGRIALEFTREAGTAGAALASAAHDVSRAIPGVELIEAGPDYVSVADIADVMGVSRQRARALIEASPTFPLPVHDGTSALFHLAPVLEWLVQHDLRAVDAAYLEVARAAMRINLSRALELVSQPA